MCDSRDESVGDSRMSKARGDFRRCVIPPPHRRVTSGRLRADTRVNPVRSLVRADDHVLSRQCAGYKFLLSRLTFRSSSVDRRKTIVVPCNFDKVLIDKLIV